MDWSLFPGSAWSDFPIHHPCYPARIYVKQSLPHGYARPGRGVRTAPANTHMAGEPLFCLIAGYPRRTGRFSHTQARIPPGGGAHRV